MQTYSSVEIGYNPAKLWLILIIVIFMSLNSCSGVRSIRGAGSHYKSPIVKSEELISKEELADDIQSNVAIADTERTDDSKYSKLVEIVGDRLPTIREQMQVLADSQNSIKQEIYAMKEDINQIRNLITDMKTIVENTSLSAMKYPETGAPSKSNNYTLLSDENSKDDELIVNKDKNKFKKKAISETFMLSDEKVKESPKAGKMSAIEPNVSSSNTDVKFEIESYRTGLEHFKNRNYSAAAEHFIRSLREVSSKKQEAEINYYIGESYYFLNNYTASSDYFNKVLSYGEGDKLDAARIRKAEANLKAGNINEAKSDYQALIRNHPGSSHIPKARKMLQQL